MSHVNDGNNEGWQKVFTYTGEDDVVPKDVTHVRVDPSVRAIKDKAFWGRRQLRIVILNDELEEIGMNAFNMCTSLEQIKIPNAVRAIRDKAFYDCSGLTSVTLGDGLEEIGMNAFRMCISLEHIVIPNAVRTIGDCAFKKCPGLTTVTIGVGLEEIGREAFSECTSLNCIVIPHVVKTIKSWAFYDCSGLTSVTLGDGLEEIGKEAFCQCTSLESIAIPNSVRAIWDSAFKTCSGLMTVTLGNGLEEIGREAFYHCTSLERITTPKNVMMAIDYSAFKNCSNLTNVEFCDEINEFVSCEAMRDWWNRDVQRSLSTYCFLVKCNIPGRLGVIPVQSRQATIYDMLRRIPAISTDGLNAYFDTIDNNLLVYETYAGEDFVDVRQYYVYTGREAAVIPDGGFLSDDMCEDIPANVMHVIVHPSVKVIEDNAFWQRGQLETVILNDGLEEIGACAFESCDSLQHILIPNSVKAIKDNAFDFCYGLTTVTLGDELKEIGEEAFRCCISLRCIVIPNTVKAIQSCTFNGCSELTTVVLGNGLEEIGRKAFNRCESLERINVPHAVKTIDYSAFKDCSNLTRVEFCQEIEQFVSCEAMREWWHLGVQRSLSSYCFLVIFNIPERLGLILVQSWQANIYEMLRRIPSISTEGFTNADFDTDGWVLNLNEVRGLIPTTISTDGLDAYFGTIDSKLSVYENLSELPLLLELAIPNNDIVLRVLSFI